MLQAYSTNLTINADEAFPFNNIVLKKGCTAALSAPSTIQLNSRGLYMISVDCYGTAGEAGEATIQLTKNGIALPQAINSTAAAATDTVSTGFQTLVQVQENNSNCCCSSPTVLQVLNTGIALTDAHVNIVVTKVC